MAAASDDEPASAVVLTFVLVDEMEIDELDEVVDEVLLVVHFFSIGSSESVSLVLSGSVGTDREDEMSVLLDVRRPAAAADAERDEPVAAEEPPRVSGLRLDGVAGDLFRPTLGVVERGVEFPPGPLLCSPFELPRLRLPIFGVLSPAVSVEPALEDDACFVDGPPAVGVLPEDLPFFVLLLVRFSAIRSLRTHSSYLKIEGNG